MKDRDKDRDKDKDKDRDKDKEDSLLKPLNRRKSPVAWLWELWIPHRKHMAGIITTGLLNSVTAALIPYTYIYIIDGIKQGSEWSVLRSHVLILLLLGILNYGFSMSAAMLRARMNIKLEWDIRQRVFTHVITLGSGFFHKYRTGDLVTRLTDDLGHKLSWFACSGIFRSLNSILRVIASLIMMISINPFLTIFAVIPFPFQILVFTRTVRILHKRFLSLQQVISRVNQAIENCFSGVKVVQAFRMEEQQIQRFDRLAGERAATEVSTEKTHTLVHSMYGYFWQFAVVLILLVGGWLVINGRLSIGGFVAFDNYVIMLIFPMFDLGSLLTSYRRASVSIERLQDLEEKTPEVTECPNPSFPENSSVKMQFEDVSYSIDGKTILDSIDLTVEPGSMVAVVGPVGSGKSMLLNLIPRLMDPTSGQILLEDVPLKSQHLASLRQKVGYVPQEAILFSDTLRNNIKFGRDDVSDDDILWAAHIAQFSDDIEKLPDGLATLIGERGINLSGGQKQRVSLARALVLKPKILILDDITAHLDADTEAALWEKLFDVLPGITSFVVSHRTATLEKADWIVVLDRGRIVEKGPHEELIKAGGLYEEIYSVKAREEFLDQNN